MSELGYTHWTGKPVTPGAHELALVPQTIVDGWQGFCSCGEWKTFASFYEYDTRDDLLGEIRKRFEEHKAA